MIISNHEIIEKTISSSFEVRRGEIECFESCFIELLPTAEYHFGPHVNLNFLQGLEVFLCWELGKKQVPREHWKLSRRFEKS